MYKYGKWCLWNGIFTFSIYENLNVWNIHLHNKIYLKTKSFLIEFTHYKSTTRVILKEILNNSLFTLDILYEIIHESFWLRKVRVSYDILIHNLFIWHVNANNFFFDFNQCERFIVFCYYFSSVIVLGERFVRNGPLSVVN